MPRRFRGINEYIDCACGCGKKKLKYDNWGRIHYFLRGHTCKGENNPMYGKKNPTASERCKEQIGEKNPNYGNLKPDVKRRGLHRYVESKFPKTDLCMMCKLVPPHHLANITGIYDRELKNWAWFCRSCHMKYDNIVRNFKGKRRGKSKKSSTSLPL